MIVILLATTVACGDSQVSPGEASMDVAYTAVDVHLLGTSESIAVVNEIEVLPDGTVWVLNSVEPFFVGFTSDGAVSAEYGAQGGGPEEFGYPAGFVSGGIDGEAWILDVRRHALIRIAGPDAPWEDILLPRDSVPPATLVGGRDVTDNRIQTALLGDEIVLARGYSPISSGMMNLWKAVWGADLMAVDPDGSSARRVVGLMDLLGDPTPNLRQTRGFPPFPLWFRLWASCADERIRVYDRQLNQIRLIGSDGSELAPIGLPPDGLTSVSERDFVRAVLGLMMAERLGAVGGQVSPEDSVQLLNEAVGQLDADPEQLADFLPRYVDLRCGDDGAIWIRPFDVEVGGLRGGPTWLHIAADGATRRVTLPDRFDAFRFLDGRIWGVQRDEFDVASVAWIDFD